MRLVVTLARLHYALIMLSLWFLNNTGSWPISLFPLSIVAKSSKNLNTKNLDYKNIIRRLAEGSHNIFKQNIKLILRSERKMFRLLRPEKQGWKSVSLKGVDVMLPAEKLRTMNAAATDSRILPCKASEWGRFFYFKSVRT